MRPPFAVAIVLMLLTPAVGVAQAGPNVGDRVRVHQVGGAEAVGSVESISAHGLVLGSPAEGSWTIAFDRIERVDRSLGIRRRFLRNMVITMGVTAAGGGVISAATWSPCRETGFLACFLYPESRTEAFSWGFAAGGLVGIPIGVIVGLSVRGEQWQPLGGVSLGFVTLRLVPPSGTGTGVVASIPFGGQAR